MWCHDEDNVEYICIMDVYEGLLEFWYIILINMWCHDKDNVDLG